ncbi:restriction endonuclease subunit S [Streptomyces marokkonensis]|uniref:restriction endonuclease subunit S n=1 Tax=Streptomyces marokkonensis TaxID=324855 RepID=UPI0011F32093|nr:restriction endonuclease subunit S [Streptomyces marokkonensis]
MSEGGIPSELPKGWARVRLGDILDRIEAGKSYKCEPRPATSEEWGVIKVSAMTWGEFGEDENKAVPAGFSFNPDYEIRPGDILLSRANTAAYVGASVLVRNCRPRLLLSDKSLRLIPAKGVDREWLAYFLSSPGVRGEISERATGTKDSMRNISQGALADIECPLPPLAEQQRIVGALDEQLSRLVSGVGTVRGALAKAAGLRRKVLADLTAPSGVGWEKHQLGDLASTVRNGMYVSRPGLEPDGVPILRIGAVRPMRLDLSDLRYSAMDERRVAEDGYLLDQGDLLFTRYNGNPAYVGACAVVPEGAGALTYPDKLIRVQLRRSAADPKFVAMACTGGSARHVMQAAVKTTAGQAGIAGKDLKKVPIWLPSLDEQRERVRTYENWELMISRLEEEVMRSERNSEKLRRSLLAEAFAGHLIPQDPADESAGSLLDRICAEREVAGATKSRRRSPRRAPAQLKRAVDPASALDVPPPSRADVPALASATQPTLDLEMPS